MTDLKYLRQYWARADAAEDALLTKVRGLHPEDAVQAALDRFGRSDGSARLDNAELNRLHRNIKAWGAAGILTGEFGLRARDAANRKRIANDDAMLIYLMAAWSEYYSEIERFTVTMLADVTGAPQETVQARLSEPAPTTPMSMTDTLAVDAAYRARQLQKQAVADRQQEQPQEVTQKRYARVFEQARRWLLAPSEPTEAMPNGHHGYIDRVMAQMLSYFAIEAYRRQGVKHVRFVAVIDEKTTHNCRRLHGQVFSIDDLRPGINAPPIADPPHSCRSVLKPLETLQNNAQSDIIITNEQFGKKVGKHAIDFGLDPGNPDDRSKVLDIINDIVSNSEERRIGSWRSQTEEVLFHIRGENVVVTKQNMEFVTILKGGVTNARVQNARKL